MHNQDTYCEVVIVGAGLSGLTTARQILKQRPKTSTTVIQGLDRLGGRTNTVEINGFRFDLGAEFIGKTQTHILALAEQSGNALSDAFHSGTKIIEMNKQVYRYTSDIPNNLSLWGLIQMQLCIWKINAMARKVPTLDPKACELGYYWDSMTLQSWMDSNISNERIRVMVELAIRSIWGADPCEISFLFFLWNVHQNKDFDNLINMENGLQQLKTQLGTQHFSQFLADQITKMGARIKLGVKVISIDQRGDKCLVSCSNGHRLVCDYLVMACSPWQANKIQYLPVLSRERKLLCQRAFMGSYIKILLLYKKAYWREKGFSGEILTDCADSPLMTAFDDCKINEKGEVQPALLVFVGGHLHRFWKQRQDLKQKLITKIATLLQEPEMLHPIAVQWKAWEDQQTIGGGPNANFGPGVLTQISDLRKPEGLIHWTGTQMASVSIGYMDGAVESGKRAAGEVIGRLRGEKIKQELKEEEKQRWYSKYVRGVRKWVEWL